MKPQSHPNIEKILVIKLCCIGDVVFVTPALRALRREFPSANISYLATSWISEIVEQVPSVDRVIIYDAPIKKTNLVSKFKETFQLIRTLRRERYDAAIICHRNNFFTILCWMAGIRMRVGFAKGSSFLLTHAVNFDATQYEINRYLDLVSAIGVTSKDLLTEVCPLAEQRTLVLQRLASLGITEHEIVIGVLPGGGENPGTRMRIKRWSQPNYVQLCTKILQISNVKILLLGDANDQQLNNEILHQVDANNQSIFNVAGEFTLKTLPALLELCSIVIGGDTGPVHLAAAVNTATIFLFGPSDPRLVAPSRNNSVYLWKRVHCSPCYTPLTVMQKKYFDGKTFYCWTGTHECLETLTVDEVFDTFSSLLPTSKQFQSA